MRKFQISISMMMLLDGEEKPREFGVYADSNNVWETLAAGFSETVKAIVERGVELPSFGRKESFNWR